MNKTPLRKFLTDHSMTAQGFATKHGLSVFNVRHWTRGDKEPSLTSQLELEAATAGAVTPGDWLAWKLSQSKQAA
jgi:hypothetical protein